MLGSSLLAATKIILAFVKASFEKDSLSHDDHTLQSTTIEVSDDQVPWLLVTENADFKIVYF